MKIPNFVKCSVSLAEHSTLGVGGLADYFCEIRSLSKTVGGPLLSYARLIEAYDFARNSGLDIFTLGRGSNVLFGDYGFRGLVLNMKTDYIRIANGELRVDAGVLMSKLINLGTTVGLTGFEHFAGLPGTIGGAIYGNAGCYGSEFWDVVEEVMYFDGEWIGIMKKEPGMFKYRWSIFKEHPNWIILAVKLSYKTKGKKQVAAETRHIRDKRLAGQPKLRSVGCIFKNTDSYSAGQLIDACGLKGRRVGGAMISKEHANFFVNLGDATAYDFINLSQIAGGRVAERFGVALQEEIIRVGEF